MARTHLTLKQIRAPYNADNSEAIKAKTDDFDHSIDALEAFTGGTIDYKASCRFATTADVTLSSVGLSVTDGVTPVAGDRVLVKNQGTGTQNGIYVVGASAWTRATDCDTSAEVTSGMKVFVSEGTVNGGKWFSLTTADPITLGAGGTSLTFTQEPNAADLLSTAASKGASLVGVQDSAALIEGANVELALAGIATGNGLAAQSPVRRVRGVATTDIPDLASVSTTFDGLTLVAGDRLLLTNQNTGAQEGIYVVGTVVAGPVAPLTRAADWAAAAAIPAGTMVIVDAGTAGANTIYKLTNAAGVTVGSTNPTWERIPTTTELASTAASKGASLIGIEDAATQITATNVETALAEIVPKTIQKRTVTVAETELTGTSQAVNIGAVLPANAIVLGHEVVVNVQGALAGNDLTITVGGTTANAIVASTDLDALGTGKYQCTLGAHPRGSFGGEQLVATFAASDLASLSAGNWTINVWFFVLA